MKKVLLSVVGVLMGLPLLAALVLWGAGLREGAGRNEGSVVVQRPVAQVWPQFMRTDLLMKWASGIERIEHVSGEPGHPGSKARVTARGTPEEEPITMDQEITGVEEHQRLAFTLAANMDGMGFIEQVEYRFSEKDGATTVTFTARTDYHGFLPRLFEPVITSAAQKKVEGDLQRLKQVVEGAPVDTAGTVQAPTP